MSFYGPSLVLDLDDCTGGLSSEGAKKGAKAFQRVATANHTIAKPPKKMASLWSEKLPNSFSGVTSTMYPRLIPEAIPTPDRTISIATFKRASHSPLLRAQLTAYTAAMISPSKRPSTTGSDRVDSATVEFDAISSTRGIILPVEKLRR